MSTNLKAFTGQDFDLVARHGFECADATLNAYRKNDIGNSIKWTNL